MSDKKQGQKKTFLATSLENWDFKVENKHYFMQTIIASMLVKCMSANKFASTWIHLVIAMYNYTATYKKPESKKWYGQSRTSCTASYTLE